MTDIEYVVLCCREHFEMRTENGVYWRAVADRWEKDNALLRSRLSAVIALCEKRKPKHLKGQRDHELIKLFKEYPL